MRYLMFIVMILAVLWSAHAHSADSLGMRFRIQALGEHGYEYSSTWNPLTLTAHLRVGLVLENANEFLSKKSISFSTAEKVDFFTDVNSQEPVSCQQVSQWHLEYEPGLPSHLMFVALKGEGCEEVAKNFANLQVRFVFKGISLPHFVPFDVAVDVSR